MVGIARALFLSLLSLLHGSALAAIEGAAEPHRFGPYQSDSRQRVATVLTEVQRGAVDGREFLTLRIDGEAVGPPDCRGTTLTADLVELGEPRRRDRIERTVLAAMLGERPVVITVPLAADDCIDGKPTFIDLQPVLATP